MKIRTFYGQQTLRGYGTRLAVATAFTAVVVAGISLTSSTVQADDNPDTARIAIGLQVAPVPLNMVGKDRNLVGLGSYIVNVQADCNGCHTTSPATEYTGNPYLFAPPSVSVHQVKKVNPATYLAGGQDFGNYPAPNSPLHIVSRNLTPDYTGKAEGGHTLGEFMIIMKTGRDYDLAHPTCPPNTAQTAACVPYPFDGGLLQIMPWPAFQSMTDRDLQAIYEYLSAIPCIDTKIDGQPLLRNTCASNGKR